MSYWMIVTGLISGVIAGVPGWVDWSAIPSGTRAKGIGLVHGLGNGIGVPGLFGASCYFRRPEATNPPDLALLMSLLELLLGEGVARGAS